MIIIDHVCTCVLGTDVESINVYWILGSCAIGKSAQIHHAWHATVNLCHCHYHWLQPCSQAKIAPAPSASGFARSESMGSRLCVAWVQRIMKVHDHSSHLCTIIYNNDIYIWLNYNALTRRHCRIRPTPPEISMSWGWNPKVSPKHQI